MGRNNKIELRYFPVDVDILRDKKVRRLTRKYARGAEFYLYLLCAIYSDKGYYMPIDDETAFDIADDMRIEETEVNEMLNFCMSDKVGLFSREMREKHHILTSRGIQQRYAETIRQLKRKVVINEEYSLLNDVLCGTEYYPSDAETLANSPESSGNRRNVLEETVKDSEETGIYSEETPESSEETGINSDKNKVKESKVEENKIEENKKEEISLSAADAKERENFLKILLFDKKLFDPQIELDRFCAHYEKTGWVDANGNAIKNRSAALKAWTPAKEAQKCSSGIADIWREVYNAVTNIVPDADCTPLLTLFRGIYSEGQIIHITAADKSLVEFLEKPNCQKALRSVLDKRFGAGKCLNYRIPKR